eukprot:6303843-Amphidinium_carterae.1
MGKYQGGRLWIETEGGQHHPPNLPESPLRGTYYLNPAWAADYPSCSLLQPAYMRLKIVIGLSSSATSFH